jgi:hypothetical protein
MNNVKAHPMHTQLHTHILHKFHVCPLTTQLSFHSPNSLPMIKMAFSTGSYSMLTSSDWKADRFSKHNGVNSIREKIHTETLRQYGAHIATTAPGYMALRLVCIQKIQKEWDTKEGKHKHTPQHPQLPPTHERPTEHSKEKNDKRQVHVHGKRGKDQGREHHPGR